MLGYTTRTLRSENIRRRRGRAAMEYELVSITGPMSRAFLNENEISVAKFAAAAIYHRGVESS
jgi:hypothetical protein